MEIRNLSLFESLTRYAYLCAASYERRVVDTALFVSRKKPQMIQVFHAVDCCREIDRSVDVLKDIFPEAQLCETRLSNPLATARVIGQSVDSLVERGITEVLVDISTFTHEQLLVLIKVLLSNRDSFSRIYVVYSHSREYSAGLDDVNKWLSKGCREIRSVIGYPGRMIPGQEMTLMVLSGFEYERAVSVITQMEPDKLLVGIGMATEEELTWHKKAIEAFSRLIRDFCAVRSNVEDYEFPSYDMEGAISSIKDAISKVPEEDNIVAVPMNTKLSTVALALVARSCERLQICYAQPDVYNVEAYSVPGDKLTFVSL